MDARTHSSILKRAAANAGRLLTGKAAAGAMQLATFAIAARALGVYDFGIFSVLTAQVLLFVTLATFESNQAVISFGVPHHERGDTASLRRLFRAGTVLDLCAAALAAILILVCSPLLGHLLDWSPDLVALAQWSAPLAFGGAIGTPKGMLRLFGRFDLLTFHVTVTPGIRLLLIAILAMLGASLGWYVAAWIAAALVGAAVGAFLAWREARRHGVGFRDRTGDAPVTRTDVGLWRFSLFTNLNASLTMVPSQLATLIIAAMLGESAAGLYRVAREVGMGLLKPVDLVNQALYPDLARLIAAREWPALRRTAIYAGALAALAGSGATAIIMLAGPALVAMIFGSQFAAAVPVMALIGVAVTLRVTSLAAEPIMYALARPNLPFAITLVASVLFCGILWWRLPLDGLIGAGIAFVAYGIVGALLSALAAAITVRNRERATG